MAAADVSALVDVVSSPDPTPSSAPEPDLGTDVPDVGTTDVLDTDPSPEGEVGDGGGEPQPDGEKPVDGRTNPAQIRSALKALRDSDPKNAPIARDLNNAYGRYTAYKESFPTVADARNAKAFIDANGGIEGLTSLHETVKSVQATDDLLYAGDPRVLDGLYEDMQKAGKPDAFAKLAGPYLDKLRTLNEKAYFDTMKPHFYQGLVGIGLPGFMQGLVKALSGDAPNIEGARGLVSELSNWFDNLRNGVETADKSRLDPDRQAFEKERTKFYSEQQQNFQRSVATDLDSYSARTVGAELKPYLNKYPLLKAVKSNPESMKSLAIEVMTELRANLGDDAYKKQMDAFFSQKQPDKGRIQQYHNSKVDAIKKRIVEQVLERRYPNYMKAGAVRPAAAARPNTPAAPSADGRPEYVKSRPADNQIDWDRDPQRLLFITGKAYLKGTNRLVSWNPKWASK